MFTDEVRRLIDESVLCWLATSSAAGEPSVSPKEIFTAFGDRAIIIANIASPGSGRNIRENAQACVSFIDIFRQKGFQVKGGAVELRAGDEHFVEAEAALTAMTQGLFPFKSLFMVTAETIELIVAPRYRLFPDTAEADQVRAAMASYRVRPIAD